MDNNAVALAAIGLALTTVGGLVWVMKYFAKTLSVDLKEHTKAAVEQTVAAKEATQASKNQLQGSKEVLAFMKNLNGKLAKATIQTISEQHIEHQHVEHEEVKTLIVPKG